MNIDPQNLIPIPTIFGIFSGPLAILNGDISQGGLQTLYGLTSINLTGMYFQADEERLGRIMKNALLIGISTSTISLISNLRHSVKERNCMQILKDVFKGASGIVAVVAINALDSKVILVAQQAFFLFFTAKQIFLYGYHHSQKKNMDSETAFVLNIFISLIAGAYVYDELFDKQRLPTPCFPYNTPNHEQNIFLAKHQLELEYIYNITKTGVAENPNFPEITIKNSSQWHKLSEGTSKAVYTHPDLPNSVIKMANQMGSFRCDTNDLETHYANLQKAGYLVNRSVIHHIKTPKTVLINTPQGPIVIEEKFECSGYNQFKSSLKNNAESNFTAFRRITDLCDFNLESNHNACFLKDTENNPQIGIYDFDCNNFVERRQAYSIIIKAGTSLSSLIKISKKITGLNLVQLLMTAGAISGGVLTIYNLDYNNPAVSTADKIFAGLLGSAFGREIVQTLSIIIEGIYLRIQNNPKA